MSHPPSQPALSPNIITITREPCVSLGLDLHSVTCSNLFPKFDDPVDEVQIAVNGTLEMAGKERLTGLIVEGAIAVSYLEAMEIPAGPPQEKGKLLLEKLKKNKGCLLNVG